jgi:uncharacterized protein
MIVSMIQFILEIDYVESIKDKRNTVKSLKDRIQHKYKVSVSEVDLQDSLHFAQIGAAYVTNSKVHGEKVMHNILNFVEENCPCRIIDVKILSQAF